LAAERLLQQVLAGLPELIGAAVVQMDSGQALASYTTAREFSLSKVVGFNAEVIRQQHLAMQALLLPAEEQLEEILITLQTQLHLLRLLPDGQRFLYVVVDSRDTNLGIARAVLRTCKS
jgi:predicted regulator of Ras-like GTPase activity (Roadblock/LC7/MglB family)